MEMFMGTELATWLQISLNLKHWQCLSQAPQFSPIPANIRLDLGHLRGRTPVLLSNPLSTEREKNSYVN